MIVDGRSRRVYAGDILDWDGSEPPAWAEEYVEPKPEKPKAKAAKKK